MYRELLNDLPSRLGEYKPYPNAADRAFWEGLDAAARRSLVAGGERRLGFEYPALSATLFMDFARTGNRSRFEEPYFERRRALNDFVLAECAAGDGRFLDGAIDGIDAICSEAAWQLPAHNSYIRDTPQLPLPDPERPVLDLFACETGAQLSLALYLLAPKLDAVSPFIRPRIETLVRQRILDPYLAEHFWWMGRGEEPMNNWTPWCTQNVLMAAGLSGIAEETKRKVIEKAAASLDFFLKDYGEDGCCSEGAQYYRHAGLCLFGATEILEALCPSAFAPAYRERKIRNIALYIRNVYAGNGWYVNFADCSPAAGPAGAREFLFGKRVESAELQAFAAEDFLAAGDPTLPEEINLLYRLQSAAAVPEIASFAAGIQSLGNGNILPDSWYPSVGLLVTRSERLCLAVKAGGNGDSHNHNDTGSFTLYKDGQPCLIDIGVETYTAKTFSPRRYEIWTMQSQWHNLPSFGPYMQEAGPEYKARDVTLESGGGETAMTMELAGAWGAESGAESYRRRVTLFKSMERVTVEDSYRGREAAVLNLIVERRPTLVPGGFKIGDLAFAAVYGATGAMEIDRVPIEDPRLALAWKDSVYRVRIPFGGEISVTIE